VEEIRCKNAKRCNVYSVSSITCESGGPVRARSSWSKAKLLASVAGFAFSLVFVGPTASAQFDPDNPSFNEPWAWNTTLTDQSYEPGAAISINFAALGSDPEGDVPIFSQGASGWPGYTGAIPGGLTLSPLGVLSGNLTTPGEYLFTIAAFGDGQFQQSHDVPALGLVAGAECSNHG